MTGFRLIDTGGSRAFGEGDPFRAMARPDGDVAVIIGAAVGAALAALDASAFSAILVELGTEMLGVYAEPADVPTTGRDRLIGFARFRLGDAAASDLVEIVAPPHAATAALEAATALFAEAGLVTATCRDAPGRIVDRLARPYFNRALDALDTGLAAADDLDAALRMGLGYRRGPIELLRESGLAHHHAVSAALYVALGERPYLPARRAQIARARAEAAS